MSLDPIGHEAPSRMTIHLSRCHPGLRDALSYAEVFRDQLTRLLSRILHWILSVAKLPPG